MEKKIVKSNRRTVSMRIEKDGSLLIKAPLSCSEKYIDELIVQKTNWIKKQLKNLEKVDTFQKKFDFENKLYILGEECSPEQFDLFMLGKNNNSHNFDEIYISYANNLLIELAKDTIKEVQLPCKSIKFTKSKHFWGSFDRQGNMKINYKLIVLPKELVRYVIIHELCHGIELNHSPKFWANVKKYCPDYKKLKKQLSYYSFLLN